ncbi:XdhC family protein [Chromohalobacter canadensis]|uniref:XdhC family protein n=1 Tax=Chromohalobacter canadensis TaxID=141389 RepID=UPI0021BE64AC|nr:XdhC family protein [Chromohalobacter canadensis]MCT8467037.1 XdhC family protein [Chromohalobacter canadensis]MCT8471215.1 XdhC family protein [Chromohalobacter canadensis]MCT8497534.1 XdhC family protein [Chromohalobacter canadensis]
MQHLDLQVIEKALAWARDGETVWLCTVLATFGSSPREPGSLFVARGDGRHAGSLSGGCIEEDFLERLTRGAFEMPVTTLRYGDGHADGPSVTLPCDGILDVLVERLPATPASLAHFEAVHDVLRGQHQAVREVDLATGAAMLVEDDDNGPRVTCDAHHARVRLGPVARLIVAGMSPVALACAEFARSMGFEVIVCDPREEAWEDVELPGIRTRRELPSAFIASGASHAATAIVALTHDPRLDDLTMIEAVRTPAFYIGVMGSRRTSTARAERLQRVGGLSEEDIERLHMPIGLALGSKTPAEIALAVMADIVRVRRGKARDAL